jgi:hypothetical protein
MELTEELVRKHKDRLLEAEVTVKGHTRHSKKGKAFNVKSYQRDVKKMSLGELRKEVAGHGPLSDAAYKELNRRRKKAGGGYTIGDQDYNR